MRYSKSGKDRLDEIYRPILESSNCQVIIDRDENELVDENRFKGLFLEDILPKYCKAYCDSDVREYIQNRYGNMT